MSFKKQLYYCHECKKIVTDLEKLLFVEDSSSHSFCSEACIEKFYNHLVEYYEALEREWREKHNLQSEDILKIIGKPQFMEGVISSPDEIWCLTNDLDQKTYTYIKSFKDSRYGEFFLGIICYVYQSGPSFILMATATRQERLIDEIKFGEKCENFDGLVKPRKGQPVSIDLDTEMMAVLENKKSQYLAILLEERSPADIPFENFLLYDSYMAETMSSPDEVFYYKDEERDDIITYIKAHEREGVSFYFFSICLKIDSGNRGEEAMIPILAFPTVDGEVYRLYRKGEHISGQLKS